MNSVDLKTSSETLISSLQLTFGLRTIFQVYIENTFETLTKRSENKKKISKTVFTAYINLPFLIGNKIFNEFDLDGDGFLNKSEFSEGMTVLYLGSFEKLKQILFLILNFTANTVNRDDVRLFLSYLNSSENLISNVDLYVSEFFELKEEMTYEEFNFAILNRSLNLFILFLIFIYRKQPFTEDSLNYLKENSINTGTHRTPPLESKVYQNKETDGDIKISSEINRIIKNYFKINELRSEIVQRKKSKKNVLQFKMINYDSGSEETEDGQEELENQNKYTYPKSEEIKKYSKLPLLNEESLNFNIEFQINSPKFEMEIYKLTKENKLIKQKLVIVDKDLFLLNKCNNNYNYNSPKKPLNLNRNGNINQHINSIFSLSGTYATACIETKLADIIFYPMALINSYGSSTTHYRNIFFFKKQKELNECLNFINKLLNHREIQDDYEIKNCLGKGNFSKVRLGVNKKTSENIAIKIIKRNLLKGNEFEMMRIEIDIMKFLQYSPHVNLVKLIDLYQDKDNIFIVMELLTGGTLAQFNAKNMEESLSKNLCMQVAMGVKHLHTNGIMHRDIKPENIMILNSNEGAPVLKIFDFGLSKFLSRKEKAYEGFGTLVYTSPEILLRKAYDMKTDIWSLGVLIYFINSGSLPFDGVKLLLKEIANKICYEDLSFEKYPNFNSDLQMILKMTLNKNPELRLGIDDVLQCKWLH